MFLDVQSRWPYIRISMQFTHCTRLEGERRWGGDWGGKFTRSDFNLVWPRAPSHKLGYQEECCCLFIRKISARSTGMIWWGPETITITFFKNKLQFTLSTENTSIIFFPLQWSFFFQKKRLITFTPFHWKRFYFYWMDGLLPKAATLRMERLKMLLIS